MNCSRRPTGCTHQHELTSLCRWPALQELNYDAAAAEQFEEVRRTELAAVRSAKEAVDVLAAQNSNLEFVYRDPERNWDRSRVKGVSTACMIFLSAAAATACCSMHP